MINLYRMFVVRCRSPQKKFFFFIQDIYFVTLECQRLVDLHVDPKKKKKKK